MPKWAKEPKEGRILQGSFCSLLWELLEFGCEILCMGEEEQVATIAWEQEEAACIPYLLERFHLGGGRTTFMDCFLPGEVSSHQNSEISVAEWSQQQDSHSCGGDSLSDFSAEFWSRSGSWEGGAPHLPSFWQYEPDSFTILELLLYQVHYCICITVLDHCSTHIYIIISKLVFPGGVLSRVIDQK